MAISAVLILSTILSFMYLLSVIWQDEISVKEVCRFTFTKISYCWLVVGGLKNIAGAFSRKHFKHGILSSVTL